MSEGWVHPYMIRQLIARPSQYLGVRYLSQGNLGRALAVYWHLTFYSTLSNFCLMWGLTPEPSA